MSNQKSVIPSISNNMIDTWYPITRYKSAIRVQFASARNGLSIMTDSHGKSDPIRLLISRRFPRKTLMPRSCWPDRLGELLNTIRTVRIRFLSRGVDNSFCRLITELLYIIILLSCRRCWLYILSHI